MTVAVLGAVAPTGSVHLTLQRVTPFWKTGVFRRDDGFRKPGLGPGDGVFPGSENPLS